jgi:hypothetical protein
MTIEWRKWLGQMPGWEDIGPAELRYGDGHVISGRLEVVGNFFDDDDEYLPIHAFTSDAGEVLSPSDAGEWRLKK